MDETRRAELERENRALRAGNDRLHRLLTEARGSAAGRRNPGDGVPPGVAVLDPEIDREAKTVRERLEQRARDTEQRAEAGAGAGADHG